MIILSVNAGSSSMKFQIFKIPENIVLASSVFERIGLEQSFYTLKKGETKLKEEVVVKNHEEAFGIFLKKIIEQKVVATLDEIKGIGHRVVHGGSKYSDSVIINDEVISDIDHYSSLAPLHNPANLIGIKVCKKLLPEAINVAVFDTAFHQTLSPDAYMYAVPYEWYTDYGVRKYGFHGTSHKYVSLEIAKALKSEHLKIITCHLGNGGSISAIEDGKCIDTSLGFTPIAGIPMGTRCGDIDVSILDYMIDKTGKSMKDIMNDLNKKSGLLGVSGISSDSREIEEAIERGNERAILAQTIYINKIVQYISYYNTILGGADVIVFTAGIGENSIVTRRDIMKRLEPIGVLMDEVKNNVRGILSEISSFDSKIKCFVVPTNEELMIAKEVYALSNVSNR